MYILYIYNILVYCIYYIYTLYIVQFQCIHWLVSISYYELYIANRTVLDCTQRINAYPVHCTMYVRCILYNVYCIKVYCIVYTVYTIKSTQY